ncbi:putative shikimate O-hydroxycinnamoyltransferase [Medicago truncatula]|uniref:Anthranilate N-benzoyltransferase n=1 Tax=Medicago truncatula TaxID=3880 RepID=A0A072V033_MEDTR|nr:uncharacterized acetyltransferase At3g50280 [Medicago truncatula]KEH31455.1 anthranilate N-benzoyltransferase [Medicago truncatula]RHN62958.1 putative shikimate O-hydroxycinnamoyltransferase [Medicago truncatula]
MASIKLISTTTIQAPSHINTNSKKIHLTPWDLSSLQVEMNQKGLLFHNHQNPKDTSNQIQHLKNTLSSTLVFFPPLTGRLIIEHQEDDDNSINDDTTSCFILCNNLGALFIHAAAENTSVFDIVKPNYVPSIVHSFFPFNKVKNYEGTSKPLLAVQVTELVDGIFIGFSINHVVVDGKSFWHFINSWSEISRGFDQLSKLPTLNRWFLDESIEIPIKFPFTKEENGKSTEIDENPVPLERIFHFTKEKIAKLKSKANEEANINKISSLQALLTHLWQAVIRGQNIDPEEEIMYCLVIDVRGRIIPPLHENYFGNALQVGGVKMKAKELLAEGAFGKVAFEMNKMIASHCDDTVKRHYESWVKNPRLFQGRLSSVKALATSSSPRFDVYGNDFGWGKPVAVRSGGANKSDGTITMFSGIEEGSIDVEVCLSYDILEAMGNDPQFIHIF